MVFTKNEDVLIYDNNEELKPTKPLEILYLEDNPSDVDLLEIELSKRGNYQITSVETKEELIEELEKAYDLLICDFSLNGFSGKEAIRIAKKLKPELPSLILSGTVGEEEAVHLLHDGAYDFVLKENLEKIPRVIERVLQQARSRAEAKAYLKELEDKNALLTSILDGLDDLMFFKDTSGKYIRVNSAFTEHFKINEKNIIGKTDADLFNSDIVQKSEMSDNQVLKLAKSTQFNTDYTNTDGKRHVTETVKTPIISHGKVIGLVGISRDVTHKRVMEEQLRKNQLILSQAEEITGAGSFEFNADLGILHCTPNLIKMFGITSEHNQISIDKLYRIIYQPDRVLFTQQIEKTLENKESLSLTHRIQVGKSIKYCRTSIQADLTSEKDIFFGTIMDITHEHNHEDTVNQVQENERKRISRELHDSVGPKLSAASMYLDQVLSEENTDDENTVTISKAFKVIDESVTEVRSLSRNLSVKMVEENGLESSIEDLLDRVPKKVEKEVVINVEENSVDPRIAAQLYRITQESINNMIKYSKATTFSFSLVQDKTILKLTIKDDGVGCDLDNSFKKGNGIKNITHRVRTCNGIIRFNGARERGFGMEIKVPIK